MSGLFWSILSGTFLSYFLYKNWNNHFLRAWFALVTVDIVLYILYEFNLIEGNILFSGVYLPFILIQVPFFYFFCLKKIGICIPKRDYYYAAIIVLAITILVQQFQFAADKWDHYLDHLSVHLFLFIGSSLLFILISLYKLVSLSRSDVKPSQVQNLPSQSTALYVLILGYALILFTLIVGPFELFILLVFIEGIIIHHSNRRDLQINEHPKSNLSIISEAYNDQEKQPFIKMKYEKSTLNHSQIDQIHLELVQIMSKLKLYKNPELSIVDLARQLTTTVNNLSQVINTMENKNYYDFINQLRIDEFKKQISEGMHKRLTLISIAYTCGFNSKSSFNRNFKKLVGVSPSDYVKKTFLSEKDVSSSV